MSKILPSAAKIKVQVADFVADSKKATDKCLSDAASCNAFQEIYEISLAAHTVIKALTSQSLRPRLHAALSVAVRIPILVGVGQASVAEAELRRFVELILWAVYFTDHPVEWRKFEDKTSSGFSRDQRRPISYAAHRELGFYLEYALELMESEPSGLGTKAVENVKQAVKSLNAAVHAGKLAKTVGSVPPHETISEQSLRSFAKIQRLTLASCTLLLAAYHKGRFDRLNAIARGYFDWLIGMTLRREVRKGPFGL